MSLRLSGINPLAYMGVEPIQPPNLLVKTARPTVNDFQNINIGTFWTVYPGQELWFLISVAEGIATWVQLYPAGGGGGGASQFPTDDGTANEAGGVLNILGDGNIVTHGAGNTVTLTMAGDFVENFETDSGTAHPSSNTLRIIGGTNINTAGSTNAVTVNLDDSVSLAGSLGVTGSTTLDGSLTISHQTNGVLQTNGGGTVTATNGTNGQLLIGGGTAPVWANLTSSGGTVIITNGPNSINLESTGGGGGGGAGSVAFYAYPSSSYGVPNPGPLITPVVYVLGSGLALTVTINEGASFFAGDGVGTPASFTAPVNGIYYFEAQTNMVGGQLNISSSTTVRQSGISIDTPSLSYLGCAGNPSATPSGQGSWYGTSTGLIMAGATPKVSTITTLNMGDMVTFSTYGPGSPGPSTGVVYNIAGTQAPITPGPTMPLTYVMGYLLKEL